MNTLAFACTGALLLLVAPNAAADGVQILSGKAGVSFDTALDAPGFQLRVTGPGGFLREALFARGEELALPIAKAGWPDGHYQFELWPVNGFAKRSGNAHVAAVAAPGNESVSGSFMVQEGAIVAANAPAGVSDQDDPLKAEVIAQDLIVQGSACVGIDCTSTESFGFDTIRMKENNTRIKFQDTSVGSFPSTDWQLTANDSASGGANKFSIEDITGAKVPFTVIAGAPSNSLFVSSTGRVGLRTSTPVLDLHISTSNTPGIRLEQTSAGGFTAQTWDVAGNEANFFVRDVTGGSRLPFRIRPGAPTSSIDISADGNVGIGTASPTQKLDVESAGPVAIDLNNTAGALWRIRSGAGNNLVFVAPDDATTAAEFTLDVAGNLTVSGNFFAQGGTQLTVPDYVFKPGYELMPLDQLQSFIESNRHLPNVRSEAEVANAGKLNMTEMQLRLLEKVEELTLYTLQQHRQIRDLEARLEEVARSAQAD